MRGDHSGRTEKHRNRRGETWPSDLFLQSLLAFFFFNKTEMWMDPPNSDARLSFSDCTDSSYEIFYCLTLAILTSEQFRDENESFTSSASQVADDYNPRQRRREALKCAKIQVPLGKLAYCVKAVLFRQSHIKRGEKNTFSRHANRYI